MNVLVLNPGHHHISFSVFDSLNGLPAITGSMPVQHVPLRKVDSMVSLLWSHLKTKGANVNFEATGVRISHAGDAFTGPALLSEEVLTKLRRQVDYAPLHIPPALSLLKALSDECKLTPIVLVFETSFFARMPERERIYAIPDINKMRNGLIRSGFHGIYHEAACAWAASRMRKPMGWRILSFCLEAHSEAAAVRNMRPLMVTGGLTPLEGLPGQSTCGELDPGVILQIARETGAGPEEIDRILTRESGLRGLTGRSATLASVFAGEYEGDQLAREVMRYRILLAAGAGVAALGGVDALVFSGRFADLGVALGNWLLSHMPFLFTGTRSPDVLVYPERLDRCIATKTALFTDLLKPATFE